MTDKYIEHLDKILDKVQAIEVKVAKAEVTLERNTDSLVEHMRRTDLLEAQVKHVETHVVRVETAYHFMLKLGAFFAVLIPLAIAFAKLFMK